MGKHWLWHGATPQIWYNCEHKLTTPKMSEPIFEACFEHVHWMALLQTRCRKRTPHGRAEAGRRPAEGRLWVMDGLRAAEGRPKAVSTDGHGKVMKSHTNQVFTWIASLKQKSWIWHLWNRGCGLWPCDSRVVNARIWLRMTRIWPASDPGD